MLTLKDCCDYCDLSDDEVLGILNGANVPPIEVCAMVQEFEDNPVECRKMLKFLQDYLEVVEKRGDSKRSHEVHMAIDHFVSNHHFV